MKIKGYIDFFYKWFLKHKLLSMLLGLIIMFSPIFIIELLYRLGNRLGKYAIIGVFNSSDILNYIGVLLGSGISAFITFSALYITIQSEKKERHNDRRLQIYPYLNYEFASDDELSNLIMMKFIEDDYSGFIDGERFLKINFTVMIENIGINDAINFTVLKINFLETSESFIREFGNIKVGNKEYLGLDITIDLEDDKIGFTKDLCNERIDIKVAYTNITGDYYEQNIYLDLQKHYTPGISSEYEYNTIISLSSVSEPLFFKNKNILTEQPKK